MLIRPIGKGYKRNPIGVILEREWGYFKDRNKGIAPIPLFSDNVAADDGQIGE